MDASSIAGLVGIIAAGCGLYIMLYVMGYFQYLGGKKQHDIPPVRKQELIDKILILNDPSKPYHIAEGIDTDLLAEWKIVDTKWWGIMNKNGLRQAYTARLLLDESRHSVRCYEELYRIDWTVGLQGLTPKVNYERAFFAGRIIYKKEYAKGYAMKELKSLEMGKVYDYRFDINEIRGPIISAVEENGWEWVPVTAKRHVVFKS